MALTQANLAAFDRNTAKCATLTTKVQAWLANLDIHTVREGCPEDWMELCKHDELAADIQAIIQARKGN